jgi:diadenosine tetraphosphate (Ap4A) HIT family hydrolase
MSIVTRRRDCVAADRIAEFTDLGEADRTVLIEEGREEDFREGHVARRKSIFGALRNVLRQFHFHVVARFADDPNWPGSAS